MMTPITVDELPDFLQSEFPSAGLNCIADFSRDAIAVMQGKQEVALFQESAFEEEKVTREIVRDWIAQWLEQKAKS